MVTSVKSLTRTQTIPERTHVPVQVGVMHRPCTSCLIKASLQPPPPLSKTTRQAPVLHQDHKVHGLKDVSRDAFESEAQRVPLGLVDSTTLQVGTIFQPKPRTFHAVVL